MQIISLFVGSVYGTALMTARSIAAAVEAAVWHARIHENPSIEDFTAEQGPVLICTSTTGQGELPGNLVPFYVSLRERMPLQPGRPFGIVVLGDSSYGDTFCGAGELMSEALLELGCRPVLDPLRLDALEVTEPETVASAWSRDWLAALPHPEAN